MRDEVFDLFARSITQGLGATEIHCVGFDQFGVQRVLPNQLAETIANSNSVSIAPVATTPIAIR
jgi:hypothetical protein